MVPIKGDKMTELAFIIRDTPFYDTKAWLMCYNKTKLLCKSADLQQSIPHYESLGYDIIGLVVDTESPVIQLIYDPETSHPTPTDHIHQGIEGTSVNEENPNLHEVKRQWRNIAFV